MKVGAELPEVTMEPVPPPHAGLAEVRLGTGPPESGHALPFPARGLTEETAFLCAAASGALIRLLLLDGEGHTAPTA